MCMFKFLSMAEVESAMETDLAKHLTEVSAPLKSLKYAADKNIGSVWIKEVTVTILELMQKNITAIFPLWSFEVWLPFSSLHHLVLPSSSAVVYWHLTAKLFISCFIKYPITNILKWVQDCVSSVWHSFFWRIHKKRRLRKGSCDSLM